MPTDVELRHLRYFTAVAAHGSFNRAAQVLHLTQPALSRQVKDLEDEIGVPLLVRGTNSVTLTPTGETFYEHARDILAHADRAIAAARGDRGTEVVRVGYIPTTVYGVITKAVKEFRTTSPRVHIELVECLPKEMKVAVENGRLDLAILPEGNLHLFQGFRWSELLRFDVLLVMPADHPLARLKKIPPTRLRDLPLIGLGKESFPGYALHLRARLQSFGVTPRFIAFVDGGIVSLFSALEAHHAAAVLGETVVSTLPRNLVARPFTRTVASVSMMIGVPESRPNQHAEAFVAALRQEAERQRIVEKS